MNTSNQHLLMALEKALSVKKFDRRARRTATKLANTADRRGLLRVEALGLFPRCQALAISELHRKFKAAHGDNPDLAMTPEGKPTLSLSARLAARARTALAMTKAAITPGRCQDPPPGFNPCTREPGHEGPCALWEHPAPEAERGAK